MIEIIDALTTVVGVIMGTSSLLQLKRILARRHSDDVSLAMLWVLTFGSSTWLMYGLAHQLTQVIVANAVGLICQALTMIAVYRFRTHPA